jgi:hypothetical protein
VEKTRWNDHVRKDVLQRVKEERNNPETIKRRKANWICHVLRKSCLLKHITIGKIDGKIEVRGRQGRCKKLLNDHKEKNRFCKLKEEALDHTMWRSRFGRGYGPIVRQTPERLNE